MGTLGLVRHLNTSKPRAASDNGSYQCMTAIDWGFGVEETARRLMEELESKASERGENYALETAGHAALFYRPFICAAARR